MKNITIDTLKIHDVADSAIRYYVQVPISGIAEVPQRITQFSRAGEDGVYIANIFEGQRTIHMEGAIVAQNADDYQALRRALATLQQPTRDVNGVLQQKTAIFTNDDGVSYSITGQVTNLSLPDQYLRYAPFMIDFICDDWFFDYSNEQTLTLTIASGGGFILPVILPAVFEAGIGNSGTATNSGNTTAYPTITLTKVATNPRIVNQTTGQFISFALTTIETDSLVIDMKNKTATLNGESAMQYVQDGSTWWGIEPGNNTIALSTAGGGDDAIAVISFFNTFAGI